MWLSCHGRGGRRASADDVELLFLRKQKSVCQLLFLRPDWNDGKGIYGYNTISCKVRSFHSVVIITFTLHAKRPGSESSGNSFTWDSLVTQLVKNPPTHQESSGFDPCVGKIPWRGERLPFQYSGLENSMDYVIQGITKSQTWLSNFHFDFHHLVGSKMVTTVSVITLWMQ